MSQVEPTLETERLRLRPMIAEDLAEDHAVVGSDQAELTRLVAVVRPDNDASRRVLSKLDFRHDHDGHHYGVPVQVWTLDV